MWVGVIYFIVIFLSNTVGAISGMGGGVIIKPVLDALPYHEVDAIAFYSAVSVFTMSIASTVKQVKSGFKIDVKSALAISLGSVVGGLVGDNLFKHLLRVFPLKEHVQLLQNIIMVITLVLVLLYTLKGKKSYHLKNFTWFAITGFILGFISTLLGIGGGPINVCLLMLLFSMDIKESVVYSLITIFFSQASKLVSTAINPGFAAYDLTLLLFIIPAALLGGWLGGRISGRVSEKTVKTVYVLVVLGIIAINVYTIFGISRLISFGFA